jgi:hypothetical protein
MGKKRKSKNSFGSMREEREMPPIAAYLSLSHVDWQEVGSAPEVEEWLCEAE